MEICRACSLLGHGQGRSISSILERGKTYFYRKTKQSWQQPTEAAGSPHLEVTTLAHLLQRYGPGAGISCQHMAVWGKDIILGAAPSRSLLIPWQSRVSHCFTLDEGGCKIITMVPQAPANTYPRLSAMEVTAFPQEGGLHCMTL